MRSLSIKYRFHLLYGGLLALALLILKWIEMQLVVKNHSLEIYTALIAAAFTGLGIWITVMLRKPKIIREIEKVTEIHTVTETIFIEKEAELKNTAPDENTLNKTGISKRELEVLQLMAKGMSNLEIAEGLFVSESTIKTHVARIFEKLNAKRRTQAVEIAKQLKIID